VDDHNKHRHQVPCIEGTWKTITWENCVFAFILAISEVNIWLAICYFVWGERDDKVEEMNKKDKLVFSQIELDEQLVMNPFLPYQDNNHNNDMTNNDAEAVPANRRSTRMMMELEHFQQYCMCFSYM